MGALVLQGRKLFVNDALSERCRGRGRRRSWPSFARTGAERGFPDSLLPVRFLISPTGYSNTSGLCSHLVGALEASAKTLGHPCRLRPFALRGRAG